MDVQLAAGLGDSAQRFAGTVGDRLPRLIGAPVIVLVGRRIATALRTLLMRLLPGTGMPCSPAPPARPRAATRPGSIPARDSFIADAIDDLPDVIPAIAPTGLVGAR